MKTTTKQLLISAPVILVLGIITAFSQQGGGERYLTMRVVEAGFGSKLKITICDESGKSEEQVYNKITQDSQLQQTEHVNQAINELARKNYRLVSATGGDSYSTYIFEKR